MPRGMPLPLPDLDTQPFWDGCAQERFLVPHCEDCRAPRWPPGPMCPVCRSTQVRWVESSGRGRVYSWVVVDHPPHPDLADEVPYAVALVDLEEGVRVVGNVSGCEPHALEAGLAVAVCFEALPGGERLPSFRVSTNDGDR